MHRYLEDILVFSREKAETWRDEATGLLDLATDVGLYASERLKQRYRPARPATGSFENVLNQIVIEAANGLIEAKKEVAVAIADEKRLAKQAEVEHANSEEWARRAALAEAAGDASLTREARAREREHAETAFTFKTLWTRQAAAVAELKSTLRALDGQVEQIKRNKNRVLAARTMARVHEDMRETQRRMDETIRLLGRLAEATGPVDKESPLR